MLVELIAFRDWSDLYINFLYVCSHILSARGPDSRQGTKIQLQMGKIQYYTQEGLDHLKKELNELKTKGLREIAKQIGEARENGDLKENAEYDAAKEAQGLLELRITKLEAVVMNARIMDKSQLDTSEVRVLSTVRISHQGNGQEMTYQLVSEEEADLKQRKISISSPIGKGLIGKKVGDLAQIDAPAGPFKVKVLEISL